MLPLKELFFFFLIKWNKKEGWLSWGYFSKQWQGSAIKRLIKSHQLYKCHELKLNSNWVSHWTSGLSFQQPECPRLRSVFTGTNQSIRTPLWSCVLPLPVGHTSLPSLRSLDRLVHLLSNNRFGGRKSSIFLDLIGRQVLNLGLYNQLQADLLMSKQWAKMNACESPGHLEAWGQFREYWFGRRKKINKSEDKTSIPNRLP